MHQSLGLLKVTIPYSYTRNGVIYYQRAVPTDLLQRFQARNVKVKLSTKNLHLAATQIAALNACVEQAWDDLRQNPSAQIDAPGVWTARLAHHQHSLAAGEELTKCGFDLGLPIAASVGGLRDVAGSQSRAAFSPAFNGATASGSSLAQPASQPRLSEALTLYLRVHPKREVQKFVADVRRSFAKLLEVTGDEPLENLTREDGHKFVSSMRARGFASGSIRRDLNAIRAVIETFLLEKRIDRKNPFSAIPIPDEGSDAVESTPYSAAELDALVHDCVERDDDMRWLAALVADTGARLAEVAGLGLDDIVLDADTPHLVIRVRPWRSLKNRASVRLVPLVGVALWAAQRVKEKATKGQSFAFPRYTTKARTNANSASAALNKWIKDSLALPHTVHELRHTMADRLRDVECPQDIRFAIGGWTQKGIGETYGKGYSLRVLLRWLGKVECHVPPHQMLRLLGR